MIFIAALYTLAVTFLALHGAHVLLLVAQYLRLRSKPAAGLPPLGVEENLPVVTVQVPMYNERYVADRCIDAIAALDWPVDRLQIQILDDSTDDTTAIARARVDLHRRRGIDITLLHRPHRAGYKAGALAAGLTQARGEYVAIFDADFVPAPDFLRRLMPHFNADPAIGFVQARWSHLNGSQSALARALSIAVDGHFVVEQFARNRSGWPMIFNGSAGIWRAATIRASGGWQGDTLCEDMDLSYRAALAGWRCLFAPEVVVPQEEPTSVMAIKSQHSRWAKGGAQCLRKSAPAILTSARWSIAQKAMGILYLSGYVAHLLMVLVVLLWLPLALDGQTLKHLPLTFLGLGGLGLPIEYAVAQRALHKAEGRWWLRLRHLPLLLIVGFGVALNNALAVISGLLTRGGEFHRTPKVRSGEAAVEGYWLRNEAVAWLELAMALYALVAAIAMWRSDNLATAVFLLIYFAGFGGVGAASLIETARAERGAVRATMRPTAIGGAESE